MEKNSIKTVVVAVSTVAIIIAAFYLFRNVSGSDTEKSYSCADCNVVVILIDTLRADRLPSYGHSRDTAPFLSSLFEKSVVFEKAFSASSWTAPATASIFTSLLPSDHGIIIGFMATRSMMKKGSSIKMNRLPQKYEVLGEAMKNAGYNTIGVADNLNIGSEMGFDRGFMQFKMHKEKGAKRVNKTAIEYLDAVDKSKPYFAYLHYMDVHAPYKKHSPWFEECMKTSDNSKKENLFCAYDSEIRYLDGKIEEMFKRYNWFENTVVVVLSDHGEEFWEHGDRGHARTLYTEVIHVPFAIYHPKLKAQRISQNVHTYDLMPTLADLTNLQARDHWQGISLVPLTQGKEYGGDRLIFSERLRDPHSASKWWRRSVIVDQDHYIETDEPEKETIEELYDLKNDFSEQVNIVTEKPETASELSGKLDLLPDAEAVQNREQENVDVEVDKELYDQLKSLGYIG